MSRTFGFAGGLSALAFLPTSGVPEGDIVLEYIKLGVDPLNGNAFTHPKVCSDTSFVGAGALLSQKTSSFVMQREF